MTDAFERRMQRALATTHDALARSDLMIWSFGPEQMPVLIDLLIAQGRLSESDRPHCVHWKAVTGSRDFTAEDAVKLVDADEMLEAAGIRTPVGEAWDALAQGMEVFEAFMRDHYGGLEPEERALYEKMAVSIQRHPTSRA